MTSRRSFRSDLAVAFGFAFAAIGCGPTYHPVTGVVLLGEKPLADAAVAFHPVESGPVGHAVTDAEGRFDLMSANQRGMVVGEYRVTVAKVKVTGMQATPEGVEAGVGAQPVEKWFTPKKYASIDSSGLSAKVPSSEPYRFELSDR